MPDFSRPLLTELTRHGATDIEITRSRGGHPRLYFTHNGTRQFLVFPSSSVSASGLRNSIAQLLRIIGASRPEREAKERRPYRKPQERHAGELAFSVRPNPLDALAPVRAAMEAGSAAYLCGRCDVPPSGLPDWAAQAFRRGWWSTMEVLTDG